MLDRKEILNKAYHDCMAEMYAKSQPEADYDNLIEEYRTGKIGKDERIYERHYLSQDEFLYIRDKYKNAYEIQSHWKDDIEILEDYLNKGGHKDKYIEDWEDEHGHHPGYRSYEEVQPLKEQIKEIMKDYYIGYEKTQEEIAEKIFNKVMETIKNCKDYYRFDREEDNFDCNIAFGASPTSDPETVKQWWKDHYDVDIEIEERNPLLFWEQDYYGDEFEEVMEEEDGPDWKEKWDKKWKDEVARKKAESEKRLKELQEKYEKEKNETKE